MVAVDRVAISRLRKAVITHRFAKILLLPQESDVQLAGERTSALVASSDAQNACFATHGPFQLI